ncbi:MAG: LacI family DNA-binding transcriptional regulator [Kiritimatiellia bacterium]
MKLPSTRLTMQQVAEQLELSRMTVSSVINGLARERGVKKETELRVREFLKTIGYVPSIYARRLRKKEAPTIGVLHAGFLMSHLLEAYNMLTNELVSHENAVDIVALPRPESREGLEDFVGRGVPALLWIQNAKESAIQHERIDDLFPYLAQFGKVVIYNHSPAPAPIEARMDELGIHRIVIDRPAAYRIAATFLAGLGHKVLALPDVEAGTLKDMRGREAAIFRAAGIDSVFGLLESGEETMIDRSAASGRLYAERLVEAVRGKKVTAAWIFDDEIAGYTLGRLAELGVRVPHDLTLLGFDGLAIGAAFAPPLTTIAVPVADMVSRVSSILNPSGSGSGPLTHVFQPTLLERSSHAPARQA